MACPLLLPHNFAEMMTKSDWCVIIVYSGARGYWSIAEGLLLLAQLTLLAAGLVGGFGSTESFSIVTRGDVWENQVIDSPLSLGKVATSLAAMDVQARRGD